MRLASAMRQITEMMEAKKAYQAVALNIMLDKLDTSCGKAATEGFDEFVGSFYMQPAFPWRQLIDTLRALGYRCIYEPFDKPENFKLTIKW